MKQEPIIIETYCQDFRVHQLKTIEPYFTDVFMGNKTFEVRKFDREYQVGDILQLIEYNPETNAKGSFILKRITYMLTDPPYVPEGYVILGIIDEEDLNPSQLKEGLFETRAMELLYKWFHGMSDDEMVEFEGITQKLLNNVRQTLRDNR